MFEVNQSKLDIIASDPMQSRSVRAFARRLSKLPVKHREIFERAALTFANLEANGGSIQIAQMKIWWNVFLGSDPVDQSSVFSRVDSSVLASPTGEIFNGEEFDDPYVVKHTESTENTERMGSTTYEKTLTPVGTKILWEPSYDRLRKSVQADPTGQLLMTQTSILYRNGTAKILWVGDTDSTNARMSAWDGFCKKFRMETS